ncbi:hypothetical protein [Clostridium sp.]|uniref:hypothetical protein n=1 Tax=Clostridium sp. TaxID=1506 RepID=UPI0032178824
MVSEDVRKLKNIASVEYEYKPDTALNVTKIGIKITTLTDPIIIAETSTPVLAFQNICCTNVIGPGEILTYTIVGVNQGNVAQTNLVIVDELDDNVIYIEDSAKVEVNGVNYEVVPAMHTTGHCEVVYVPAISPNKGMVTITLFPTDSLNQGDVVTVKLSVKVKSETQFSDIDNTISNKVYGTFSYTPLDGRDQVDNELSKEEVVTTEISYANVTVTKSVVGIKPKQNGEAINYLITLENWGNVQATGVRITDLLPEEVHIGGNEGLIQTSTDGVNWISMTDKNVKLDINTNILIINGLSIGVASVESRTITPGKLYVKMSGKVYNPPIPHVEYTGGVTVQTSDNITINTL